MRSAVKLFLLQGGFLSDVARVSKARAGQEEGQKISQVEGFQKELQGKELEEEA